MQYGIYYNTDTLHLQGALIHTALYTDTFTICLQADYNTDALQDALIHTALYAGSTYILQYRYSTFTGRLNTHVTSHFLINSIWALSFCLKSFFRLKSVIKSIRADYVGTRLASSLFYFHFLDNLTLMLHFLQF